MSDETEQTVGTTPPGVLGPGQVWVEVTSHRARDLLQRAVPDLGHDHGVWPKDGDGKTTGWPYGEYYKVDAEVAATLGIKGVKVRKVAPRGDIFVRWRM